MLTLALLNAKFPKTSPRPNKAVSGYIPMSVFEDYEDEFRLLMKQENLQLFFRGPRVSNLVHKRSGNLHWTNQPTRTMRRDAEYVVFYPKLS